MTRNAANGTYTDNGMPRSVTAVTPFLAVRDARRAVSFYRDVLGAEIISSTEMPGPGGDPVVVHAALDFSGRGRVEVGEAIESLNLVPPPGRDDSCYSLGLFVTDVDAVTDRAVAAGATLREKPQDFVSGDRYSSIRDPYGVRWSVMTRIDDISDEESAARVAEWAASMSS